MVGLYLQRFRENQATDCKMSKIIGAVEIGTSYTKALIGEVSEDRSLNLSLANRFAGMKGCEKLSIFAKLHPVFTLRSRMLRRCQVQQLIRFTWPKRVLILRALACEEVPVADYQMVEYHLLILSVQPRKRRESNLPRKIYVHHVRMPIRLDGRSVEPSWYDGTKVELAYWSIEKMNPPFV